MPGTDASEAPFHGPQYVVPLSFAGERTCGCYSCDETVALDETLESVLVLTILVVVRAFLTLSTIRRDRGPLAVVARESPRRSKESRTN